MQLSSFLVIPLPSVASYHSLSSSPPPSLPSCKPSLLGIDMALRYWRSCLYHCMYLAADLQVEGGKSCLQAKQYMSEEEEEEEEMRHLNTKEEEMMRM